MSGVGKRGPKIPEGENRTPRDVVVGVCLTKEESDTIDKAAKELGFRSRSGLIAFIIEPLVKDGFSGMSFVRLGRRFAKLWGSSAKAKVDLSQFNIFRRSSIPNVDAVNQEQK